MDLVGQTIQQYHILSRLGEGGMGVVYKARDTRLNRLVALKFLPAELSRDGKASERFRREAQAASALNHPNICTIHDIKETDDGQLFIVMACYEGETLKDRPSRDRAEALSLARQIASGLAAAHAAGIVHRDIKPANVIVTNEGRAVILDFGIAKLSGGIDLTQTGSTVGTTHYMSPEQTTGEEVDHQTDLWAVGAVLYEMLSGQKPFPGAYHQAVVYGILHAEPAALDDEEVMPVLRKALAKDKRLRYSTADELVADLDAIEAGQPVEGAGAVVTPPRRPRRVIGYAAVAALVAALVTFLMLRPSAASPIDSVAVLPLANLSGDSGQEFMADGMTDALINELSKIGALQVSSRQSVMRYKDSDLSLPEIARELGVDAIVNGAVLVSGDDIRVTAQLVAADSEANLWADSYDYELADVLVLHSELAQEIARQIQVRLTPEEEARLAATREVDPQAYRLYLQGHHHLYKLSPQDTQTAIDYFEESLAIDSTYAEPYAAIAAAWMVLRQMGVAPPEQAGPAIMEALAAAIAIDPTLASVHYTRGMAQGWGAWDFAAAEASFRRAIEINPSHAEAHAYLAHILNIVRKPEGLEYSERSIELDPHNSLLRSLYAAALFFNRRYEEAVEQARRSQESAPRNFVNFEILTGSFHELGRLEEAYRTQLAEWTVKEDEQALHTLRAGYEEGGPRFAFRALAEMLAERSQTTFVRPLQMAWCYAWAGEGERTLDWLERGYDARDPGMPYVGVLPIYDVVRDHPRYDAMLERMGLTMWMD